MRRLQGSQYYISDAARYLGRSVALARQELGSLKRELAKMPEENLCARRTKNGYVFTEANCRIETSDDGKQIKRRIEVGITGNEERIYQLARKKYLQARICALESWVTVMENAEGYLQNSRVTKYVRRPKPNDVLKQYEFDKTLSMLEGYGLDLNRIRWSKSLYDWQFGNYARNEKYKENKIFPTRNSILMRSKAERYTGNVLEERNIPYRYEPLISIDGEIFSPDFEIRRMDGTTVYVEFCGLLGDEGYNDRLAHKIERYRAGGLILGVNFFIITEEDIKEPEALEKIISRATAI